MRRARIVGVVAAAAAVGSTALAGVAEAKPFGERFHDCGHVRQGGLLRIRLMVRFEQVIDGRFQGGGRGSYGLIYFAEHVAFTSVL